MHGGVIFKTNFRMNSLFFSFQPEFTAVNLKLKEELENAKCTSELAYGKSEEREI